MRNKAGTVLVLGLLLMIGACNIPERGQKASGGPDKQLLWDLNAGITAKGPSLENPGYETEMYPTSTPQLYGRIDFESAFKESADSGAVPEGTVIRSGSDSAEWSFFDPVEYSSGTAETLYAAFDNTGSSTWTGDYYLDFYAGVDPSKQGTIRLGSTVHPGERGVFSIPVLNTNPSWKSCWQMKNTDGQAFYEFCYNHGSGENSVEDAAAGVPGKEGYWAFQKTNGSAPARYSGADISAEFQSSNPKDQHTFKAYDHFENVSFSIRNNGSTDWDASYSLVFYSGYNWMHQNTFPLTGTVRSGETAVIVMPMEIIEDKDKWYTCWYLASPDGKNLCDFCYNYYTGN